MKTNQHTSTPTSTDQTHPGPRAVYKVWLEIEQYDELTQDGVNMDAPGASLAEFAAYEEAYAFARSVHHAFSTHEPQTGRGAAAGTREVPQDVLSDIEQLLDYLFHDELRHCRESASHNPDEQNRHIFHSLANVRGWLDGKPRSVNWWLKNG